MKKQAQRFGAEYRHGRVVEAHLRQRPFTVKLEDGELFETRTLIIATGASARWLNLAERAEADRPWREFVRHLRWLFLPGKKLWWLAAAIPPWKRPTF